MAEYIEREALRKKYLKFPIYSTVGGVFVDAYRVQDAIKTLPASDVVEVKHGEWHLLYNCANEGVYCSVCHKKVYKTDYANQKIKSPFCPNCGAKMDKKEGAEG